MLRCLESRTPDRELIGRRSTMQAGLQDAAGALCAGRWAHARRSAASMLLVGFDDDGVARTNVAGPAAGQAGRSGCATSRARKGVRRRAGWPRACAERRLCRTLLVAGCLILPTGGRPRCDATFGPTHLVVRRGYVIKGFFLPALPTAGVRLSEPSAPWRTACGARACNPPGPALALSSQRPAPPGAAETMAGVPFTISIVHRARPATASLCCFHLISRHAHTASPHPSASTAARTSALRRPCNAMRRCSPPARLPLRVQHHSQGARAATWATARR